MRIHNNVSVSITPGPLFKADRDFGKSLERLSTGLRISRSSGAVAGLEISESYRALAKRTDQAVQYPQDYINATVITKSKGTLEKAINDLTMANSGNQAVIPHGILELLSAR